MTSRKLPYLVRGHAVIVNIPHVQMSIRVNSQPKWSEHTMSILFFSQKTVLVLAVVSSVDPHEMMQHAAFLLGLHCLPNYIFKCEKWCEARGINP